MGEHHDAGRPNHGLPRTRAAAAAAVVWVAGAACRGADVGGSANVPTDATPAGVLGFHDRWFARVSGLDVVRPSVGVDGRSAYLAARTVLTAYDLTTGDVRWRSTAIAGDGAVASDGALVVHAADHITALDATTGATRWQAGLEASAGYAGPAMDAARVYAGTGGWTGAAATVLAYARDTGVPPWRAEVGRGWTYRSGVTGLAVAGDVLYATARQCVIVQCGPEVSWVIALDAATGAERWRVRLGAEDGQTIVNAPPRVAGDLLLLNDYANNATLAVSAATHGVAWRVAFQPGYFGSTYTPPAVDASGRVYVASGDQTVYALDARTGREAWRSTSAGSFSGVVRCGAALVARRTGLVVLDPADGRVIATRLDGNREIVESNLAVVGDVLVAATTRGMAAFTCR